MSKRDGGMIPEQRRKLILDLLFVQEIVSIHQLSDRAGASFATIRRDLDQLASEGLVRRTHGGASLVRTPHLVDLSPDRLTRAGRPTAADRVMAAKHHIGSAAADRLEDGQAVIFDAGIAGVEAARRVVERGLSITAVTNNLATAQVLAQSDSVRLIVIGGTRMPGTATLHGDPGRAFLETLHADVTLVAVQAIAKGRLCDNSVEIAAMKRRAIAAGRTVILLADSWKFGGPAFCDVCSVDELDEIITDQGIAADQRRAIDHLGVAITVTGTHHQASRKRG